MKLTLFTVLLGAGAVLSLPSALHRRDDTTEGGYTVDTKKGVQLAVYNAKHMPQHAQHVAENPHGPLPPRTAVDKHKERDRLLKEHIWPAKPGHARDEKPWASLQDHPSMEKTGKYLSTKESTMEMKLAGKTHLAAKKNNNKKIDMHIINPQTPEQKKFAKAQEDKYGAHISKPPPNANYPHPNLSQANSPPPPNADKPKDGKKPAHKKEGDKPSSPPDLYRFKKSNPTSEYKQVGGPKLPTTKPKDKPKAKDEPKPKKPSTSPLKQPIRMTRAQEAREKANREKYNTPKKDGAQKSSFAPATPLRGKQRPGTPTGQGAQQKGQGSPVSPSVEALERKMKNISISKGKKGKVRRREVEIESLGGWDYVDGYSPYYAYYVY